MSRSLWFHPEADRELNDAVDFYDSETPRLGACCSANTE